MLNVVRVAQLDHVLRSKHVVEDRLGDIGLHQRHVLVRRGVKHGVRRGAADHPRQSITITDVRDDRFDGDVREGSAQLLKQLEDRVLASPEGDDAPRLEARQLPTQLTADRPTSARDHDHTVANERADLLKVGLDRLSPKQILNLDLAQRVHVLFAGENLVQAGNGPRVQASGRGDAHDVPDGSAGRSRHRDDDVGCANRACCALEHLEIAHHGNVV